MKSIHLIAFVCMIFNCGYVFAQTNAASLPKDGWYKIRIIPNGTYLTVENVSRENGANLIQAGYADQRNQQFYVRRFIDGTFTIEAAHSNRFVCASRAIEGERVVQGDSPDITGKWRMKYSGECSPGIVITYGSTSIPMNMIGQGPNLLIKSPEYHDGATDCVYKFMFEPIPTPMISNGTEKTQTQKMPGGVILKKTKN
ncbi:RICIN domain-containing protein [Terrimonas sp. NA20]|uniref:RICIN domain-containing protein n=1 Tax=Terrimonas ginsenosidimutans TaxID=2908004 RepID=A0ABS9KUE5_9BACT|nr:RICIN domain-containing protein [Terrimonas ginsenosidimutans]MCG2615967.1 RICIN domain-containing protein [Terrimonas ginsenosidimutans]